MEGFPLKIKVMNSITAHQLRDLVSKATGLNPNAIKCFSVKKEKRVIIQENQIIATVVAPDHHHPQHNCKMDDGHAVLRLELNFITGIRFKAPSGKIVYRRGAAVLDDIL
jgi:hypothetical protein